MKIIGIKTKGEPLIQGSPLVLKIVTKLVLCCIQHCIFYWSYCTLIPPYCHSKGVDISESYKKLNTYIVDKQTIQSEIRE